MSEASAPSQDINALAKGGRTNMLGFMMRLAARLPFLFIAGRAYGPDIVGRYAIAVLVIEFAALVATLGLKRGLAQALATTERPHNHVVFDALMVAMIASALAAGALILFPQAMFPNSPVTGMRLKGVKARGRFAGAQLLISSFQAISFKLADMATEIEAAELLIRQAADLKNRGMKMTKESAMAKYFASEVAVRAATEAVQIFGGYGYTKDFPVEKFYRDSKLCTIGEGTSEIQKIVIAREILNK